VLVVSCTGVLGVEVSETDGGVEEGAAEVEVSLVVVSCDDVCEVDESVVEVSVTSSDDE
jgi:hypothetical protein